MSLTTQSRLGPARPATAPHPPAGPAEGAGTGLPAGAPALPAPRSRGRSRRASSSSRGALAMLTLLPIHNPLISRLHVAPREPDGRLRVLDRFTGEELVVYTPRFVQQYHAGHIAGRWYVRRAAHVGAEPVSRSFPTARSAVEGVAEGRWSVRVGPGHSAPGRLRVIWQVPARDRSKAASV